MKVVGQLCNHNVQSLLRSAYSDTAAVTLLWRRAVVGRVSMWIVNWEKMNKDLDISVPSYSYTTPTVLSSKIEKIMANVFYSMFLNIFYFVNIFFRFYRCYFLELCYLWNKQASVSIATTLKSINYI